MATSSEVKAGLDNIAAEIRMRRNNLKKAKDSIIEQEVRLGNIPTEYQSVIEEINGFIPTGAFETLTKDELTKMTAEFIALKAEAVTAINSLSTLTEF